MSVMVEKFARPVSQPKIKHGFHVRTAAALIVLLLISFVGCKLTSIQINVGGYIVVMFAVLAMMAPLPAYLYQKGRTALHESLLILAWELIVVVAIRFPVLIAARSHMPLQDSSFAYIDHALGVSVPEIMGWVNRHAFGKVFNLSYATLHPLLLIVLLITPFMRDKRYARQFILANLAAFAIAIPIFAFLPAVGPWYYYQVPLSPGQLSCQQLLLSLRAPAPYVPLSPAANIICFPSFHVVWAILCASALWGFRLIRIPVTLLSGMIIFSTMTTGWHYFCDVLGGVVIALVSIAIARIYAVETSDDVAHRELLLSRFRGVNP